MSTRATRSATAKPSALCCVHVDHVSLLLPSDKAMKLMELLIGAVRVDRDYQRHHSEMKYLVRGQPDIELVMVKHSQVITPTADAAHGHVDSPRLLK